MCINFNTVALFSLFFLNVVIHSFKRDGNMIHWRILSHVGLQNSSAISALRSGHLGGKVFGALSGALEFVIQISKASKQKETNTKATTLLTCLPITPEGDERSNKEGTF